MAVLCEELAVYLFDVKLIMQKNLNAFHLLCHPSSHCLYSIDLSRFCISISPVDKSIESNKDTFQAVCGDLRLMKKRHCSALAI